MLAVANDLANAADVLAARPSRAAPRPHPAPRRARSASPGSGPTLWALYPSLGDGGGGRGPRVREELELGTLDSPGAGPPFVVATTIVSGEPTEQGGAKMTRRAVSTSAAPSAVGPYSQAIATERPRLLLRARSGSTPRRGELVPGGIEAEAERVLRNLEAVLDAAGCTFADVVKTTCFLADIADFAAFNAIYARFMSDPPPARSTFQVAALPKGARVEVEAIAVRDRA